MDIEFLNLMIIESYFDSFLLLEYDICPSLSVAHLNPIKLVAIYSGKYLLCAGSNQKALSFHEPPLNTLV